MRTLIRNQCPHFGNDDDGVDEIAAEVVEHFFHELMKYETYRGGIYGGGCSTFDRSTQFGAKVGATLDGRLAVVTGGNGGIGRDWEGDDNVVGPGWSECCDHSATL